MKVLIWDGYKLGDIRDLTPIQSNFIALCFREKMEMSLRSSGMISSSPRQKVLKKQQPIRVDDEGREGPFYETAGGIPVDKPFYRKKMSVKDYIAMRKQERANDPESYRIGEVITPES